VWIGTDGQASQASVTSSSGFERLDLAAVNAALAWRYVPGKRAGVAEAMWFDIPLDWVLQ
jgi:protein TonB